jgi:hypothetical protein
VLAEATTSWHRCTRIPAIEAQITRRLVGRRCIVC